MKLRRGLKRAEGQEEKKGRVKVLGRLPATFFLAHGSRLRMVDLVL